jgi:hypothetical protein
MFFFCENHLHKFDPPRFRPSAPAWLVAPAAPRLQMNSCRSSHGDLNFFTTRTLLHEMQLIRNWAWHIFSHGPHTRTLCRTESWPQPSALISEPWMVHPWHPNTVAALRFCKQVTTGAWLDLFQSLLSFSCTGFLCKGWGGVSQWAQHRNPLLSRDRTDRYFFVSGDIPWQVYGAGAGDLFAVCPTCRDINRVVQTQLDMRWRDDRLIDLSSRKEYSWTIHPLLELDGRNKAYYLMCLCLRTARCWPIMCHSEFLKINIHAVMHVTSHL